MKRQPQKPGLDTKAILGGKFEFKCTSCGADMPLDVKSKVVRCEYCGAENVVPDRLWEILKPPPQAEYSSYPPPPVAPQPPRVPQSPYTYTPPVRRSGPRVATILLPMVITLLVAGFAVFMNLRNVGKVRGVTSTLTGGGGETENDQVVVPSFKQADVSRTVENIFTMVRKRWTILAKIGGVTVNHMKTDGTVDLGKGSEGSISVDLYDVSKFGRRLPGESSVKDAKYNVYVGNDGISTTLGEASLHEIESGYFMEVLPECPVAALMAHIKEAGYPSIGYGMLSFPDVPTELEWDWLKMGLPSFKAQKATSILNEKQEDALKEKLLKEGWLEGAAYAYHYYVAGFDAADKPRFFRFKDCRPADGAAMESEILKGLAKGSGAEPAETSEKGVIKKKRAR